MLAVVADEWAIGQQCRETMKNLAWICVNFYQASVFGAAGGARFWTSRPIAAIYTSYLDATGPDFARGSLFTVK